MQDSDEPLSIFPPADADIEAAAQAPSTPQTRSPSYRLAFDDIDFLTRPELRATRLQLELMKVELALAERGIVSTVALFGGARIPAPADAGRAVSPALAGLSRYYEEARRFAALATRASLARGGREFVVCTGGGPGVMEAGNRGAAEAGGASIGLGVVLPREQAPNAYVTPELSFNLHYFAIRKMHFLMRAAAVAIFPGGFGTLDETFETLTLLQTRRIAPIPLLLFGEAFWRRVIDFDALVEAGVIAADDPALVRFVETAEEGWAVVARRWAIED
jgi:uncharacterized protein (TIGR00730 family)